MSTAYWLAPFPVPNKHVPLYGRGRRYFPQPVEFTVPLLCATNTIEPLYYFIVDVAPDWENWKLALPQSCDNNVLCFTEPISAKGVPDKLRGAFRGYRVFTVAELRRRLPNFWRQTVVLMNRDLWLPMDSADPFNLLGFTCLPATRTMDLTLLPDWSTVTQTTLAVTTIQPNYVGTPLNTARLLSYQPLPVEDAVNFLAVVLYEPPVVLEAFKTPTPIRNITMKKLKEEPTVAHVRDFMRFKIAKRQKIGLSVELITDAYHWNDQNKAYLCDLKGFKEAVWIAENLLECLEFKDGIHFQHYQQALDAFHKSLGVEE
jgi:hypothetical protein